MKNNTSIAKTYKTARQKPSYYITTPIYYPSGKWHLGHCYTTVCCDTLARYKRQSGFDVYYLTGTDEHGQKIEEHAKEAGKTPIAFVDELVAGIKELWKLLHIDYDGFIRTTDDDHKKTVQAIFTRLEKSGDIYKSKYKGQYCTPCESFWTATQAKDKKCPDCGRLTAETEEECYFFKLSKYRDRLLKLLKETDFLEPKARVNEMVNNFLKDGLDDLAVSRTSFSHGIQVPSDPKHVIYVWIDALSNYISALGYDANKDINHQSDLFKKFWPADIHLMAKEIVRFHSLIWPALLMALDLPLPKKIYGHGWLLFGGDKMSKSKGNVVDPFILSERYGVDAIRYCLLREISFGSDCDYSTEGFLMRMNTDLSNDLGNLIKRTTAMSRQYFDNCIKKPTKADATEFDADFVAKINALKKDVDSRLEKLELSRALETIFELISNANKYIDLTRPWILYKEGNSRLLNAVLYNLLEAIRVCAILLNSFIPSTATKIFESLGLSMPTDFASVIYGKQASYTTKEELPLFARLDIKKELDELDAIATINNKVESAKAADAGGQNLKTENSSAVPQDLITIDEFFKTELKVAKVTACEKVEKADKLLKLTLDVGGEMRTVVSGIATSYTPQALVGKSVVLVANLKPAKLCGTISQGMILCAADADGKPIIVSPEVVVASGTQVR